MGLFVAIVAVVIGGMALGFESGQDNPQAKNFFDAVHQQNTK